MFLHILLEGLKHGLIKLLYSYLVNGEKTTKNLDYSSYKKPKLILPFTFSLLHKAQNKNFWPMHTPELHYGRSDLYDYICRKQCWKYIVLIQRTIKSKEKEKESHRSLLHRLVCVLLGVSLYRTGCIRITLSTTDKCQAHSFYLPHCI